MSASMEGLREALAGHVCLHEGTSTGGCFQRHDALHVECVLECVLDYLRTHEVLLGGEGLVRVEEVAYGCRTLQQQVMLVWGPPPPPLRGAPGTPTFLLYRVIATELEAEDR